MAYVTFQEPIDEAVFSPRKTRNQRRIPIKVEYEEIQVEKKIKIENGDGAKSLEGFAFKPKTKGFSSEAQKIDLSEVKSKKWEPKNWREMLKNIREMREKFPAPVDTMGCDKCADEEADEKTQRYHCLLSLMLSSQTKDQVTYDAMNRLKARWKPLTPENVLTSGDTELEDLLKPVSFYRVSGISFLSFSNFS